MPGTDIDARDASGILRDWDEIPMAEALLAILIGAALVVAIRRVVPWIAGTLPERFRFSILPWGHILRLIVVFCVVVVVTPLVIEPTAENLLAIVAGLALAIGFAFKDYVSSLIAGVVALYERPYRAGDWVRIGDVYGEVQALGLRAVEVLMPDDTLVMIPHLKIWTEPIRNDNSGRRDLMVVADYYLSPDHDGSNVRRALLDVALTSPFTRLGRPTTVVASEEPWGTHYRLKTYPIDARDQFAFRTDLTIRGKAALHRLGVRSASAIAPPQTSLEGS